jgi:hypothetical protein
MDRALRPLLLISAAVSFVTGVLLWAAPDFFYDNIGPFGPRNAHYMADLATFYLALAVAQLAAALRPSWRVPVIALTFAQSALHAFNHLLDIGEADPGWLGPVDFFALLAATGLFGWMLMAAGRQIPR